MKTQKHENMKTRSLRVSLKPQRSGRPENTKTQKHFGFLCFHVFVFSCFLYFSVSVPITALAALMNSENYQVEAGRVGSGVVSIQDGSSANYQVDPALGQENIYEFAPVYACSDGSDNDSDGLTDYPNDPGCSSASDTSERGTNQCDDGSDNDGDGLIDYPNDPDCSSVSDSDESEATGGGQGVAGGTSSATDHINSTNVPLTISPGQSGTFTKNLTAGKKVILDVPAENISRQTTFTITEEALAITETPKPGLQAKLTGEYTFRVLARDNAGDLAHSFPQKVTITITIPNMPAGTTDRGLYYLDEGARLWRLIPDAEFSDREVTFQVDHLTDFAVFYVPGLPEILPVEFLCDTNNDNKLDIFDFNALMVYWGETTSSNIADCNSDNLVDIFDFNYLMIHWTG